MVHTVTCRTDGCGNSNIGIDLDDPTYEVMCGACGEPITDVHPPIPEPEPAPEQNIVFQGVEMEPFTVRDGRLTVAPDKQVVVFSDQRDVFPVVDKAAGVITFDSLDGRTPELVTGWVGVRQ